jgi:hypothetical protein
LVTDDPTKTRFTATLGTVSSVIVGTYFVFYNSSAGAVSSSTTSVVLTDSKFTGPYVAKTITVTNG